MVITVQGAMDLAAAAFLLLTLPAIAVRPLSALGFRTPSGAQIATAFFGAIAMIVLVNGFGSLIDAMLHHVHEQTAIKLFLGIRDPRVKFGFVFLAVIVAPIAEEMVFRVFLFNAIRRYGGFWIGAIVSGILFGLAHMDEYALLPLALGGVVLCWVYAKSRNAFASMITHALFNGVSVALLFIAPQLVK